MPSTGVPLATAGDPAAAIVAEPAQALTEAEFVRLYDQLAAPLWRYARRLTGSPADADDVVQEAFCRVLRVALPPGDDAAARAVLFRIASHIVIDDWRKRKRREQPLASVETAGMDGGPDLVRRHDMARTFARLKPQERMLLWLAYVEGSPHREIASAVGVKETSVRVLLSRARRRLAAFIGRSGSGREGS